MVVELKLKESCYTIMSFKLAQSTIDNLAARPQSFGFNGLGYVVYKRTYSRTMPDGRSEEWPDTISRVTEGTYRVQQRHVESRNLGWEDLKARESADEMAKRMFDMKFLPPGRGLWAMGTSIIESKSIFASLNNCAFVSTINIASEKSKPFRFLMDMSMLGVGCGFDMKGEGCCEVMKPTPTPHNAIHNEHLTKYLNTIYNLIEVTMARATTAANSWEKSAFEEDLALYNEDYAYWSTLTPGTIDVYVVPDTREGWVAATGKVIDSYLNGSRPMLVDYSLVRPAGQELKTFGGVSSGPVPLIDLHCMCRRVLGRNAGSTITVTTIVDIMNLIGKCVVAGNVRRSSEIALGDMSEEFINLKNYGVNPHRQSYGWGSNNSVFARVGDDYSDIAARIADNGEPGVFWLDSARAYSRMNGPPDMKDNRAQGTNPCSEQTLESFELCCLVEVFIARHNDIDDFLRTLKFAYLYAKTVTLGESHWVETNRVMMRNRRIGCSVTGITQFLAKHTLDTLRVWLERGYEEIQRWDAVYSDWLAIPRSIKTTSVKPSGCIVPETMLRVADEPDCVTSEVVMSMRNLFADNGIDVDKAPVGEYKPMRECWVRTGKLSKRVLGFHVNGNADCVEVPLESGKIVVTGNHMLWVVRGDAEPAWIRADELLVGDDVLEAAE
jgi:ribonucleoside-triphosphate reductase